MLRQELRGALVLKLLLRLYHSCLDTFPDTAVATRVLKEDRLQKEDTPKVNFSSVKLNKANKGIG